MYQIIIDVCGQGTTNQEIVASLKHAFRSVVSRAKYGPIAVGIVSLTGEWPEVRLRCSSRTRLQSWLDAHGFEDRTAHPIDRVTFVPGEAPVITRCRYTEDELINTANVPHADLATSFFVR